MMSTAVTILFTMLGGVLSAVAGMVVKQKYMELVARRKAFEAHVAMCNEKNTTLTSLKEKIAAMERQADQDRRTRDWIADCVQRIGGHMQLVLPERPE